MSTPVPVLAPAIPSWLKRDFKNGRVALDRMIKVAPIGEGFLAPEAASAWTQLQLAFKATTGLALTMTGAYRTLARQEELRKLIGDKAATPGTSNHGWGCAVDTALGGYGTQATAIGENVAAMEWMAKNETAFGWSHEWSPFKNGFGAYGREPWHIRLVEVRTAPFDKPLRPVAPSHELRRDSKGGNVRALQNILIFWRFGNPGQPDGHYGAETEGAVMEMQQKLVPAAVERDEAGVYGAPTHLLLQLFLDNMWELAHGG